MHKIVQVDGGIGRVLCSTPAIKYYCENNNVESIILVTSWPAVFWHNPFVHKVYSTSHDYLWDDVIKNGDFVALEPYHSREYYTQKHHLTESFSFLLTGKTLKEKPILFLTPEELSWGAQTAEKIKVALNVRKLCAYQPYGAGAIQSGNIVTDKSFRSLSLEDAESLTKHTPTLGFINCSHIPIGSNTVWNQQFALRELFAIVASCDTVLTIDSSVLHIAASFKKTGILLLGSTYRENVGYDCFSTFQLQNYPKNYVPNRFHGFVDMNKNAMSYDAQTLAAIVSTLREHAACL